jgi:SAM-dependent methyltransferase
VRSLNPVWAVDDFHARVAGLAGVTSGARVLDLGCGRGLTVPHLLAAAGTSGEVVAVDRMTDSLAAIRERYSAFVASGHLTLVDLDIAAPLPFGSASFDSVVCQNVIECVTDRRGLLTEIHRILRPGGVAVIGHYDFDGVLLASDDRVLTRCMVHGYADQTQKWQDASDGQMGRLLPGLVTGAPFSEATTETVLFVDLSLSNDSYAMVHLVGMVALSRAFGVPEERAKAWLDSLQTRSRAGQFYYALPWTYVVAYAG